MAKLTPLGVYTPQKSRSNSRSGCEKRVTIPGLSAFLCAVFAVILGFSTFTYAAEGGAAQGSRAFSPITPYDELIAGRGGWAEVSFTVDYSGRAILLNTEASSARAFAHAFQADIEAVEFIPPRRNGQPIMSIARERFEFPATPAMDPVATHILEELRKPEPNLCPASELDAKPQPIRQPQPAYPWALRGDEVSGSAEVEFVIDRTGRVLFPRIVSATEEDFGWAAATAVTHWKYKPPTKNGVAVDTRIKDTVVFDIKKANGMW